MKKFLFRVVGLLTTVGLLLIFGALAQASSGYDGPQRWQSTTVTISADLAPVSEHWGDTLTFEVVESGAQITTVPESFSDKGVGGEAQSTFEDGNYLASCTIALPEGKTDPAILTHEFGHCLGLAHRSGVTESNMHWWAGDVTGGWSDSVTEGDLNELAELYSK